MTPFEGTSTCIETARPLQLLEVLSSVCALVVLSSRSLTSLQTSGGPLTSSRITPDSLLPFVHPPPLSKFMGPKSWKNISPCHLHHPRPIQTCFLFPWQDQSMVPNPKGKQCHLQGPSSRAQAVGAADTHAKEEESEEWQEVGQRRRRMRSKKKPEQK